MYYGISGEVNEKAGKGKGEGVRKTGEVPQRRFAPWAEAQGLLADLILGAARLPFANAQGKKPRN